MKRNQPEIVRIEAWRKILALFMVSERNKEFSANEMKGKSECIIEPLGMGAGFSGDSELPGSIPGVSC